MEHKPIPTICVNGFFDAGKTTYIQDALKNDFFYKRGTTLLILFEDGEEEYDEALLEEKRTFLDIWDGEEEITSYVEGLIARHEPDRIYLEMNAMTPNLRASLPSCLRIDFTVTLVDGLQLGIYYRNLRQQLQDMIKESQQVVFNRLPQREALDSYANIFRVMNNKASYLWEGPTGYHEKAFGVMVPYDIDQPELTISDSDYTPFYLDSLSAPARYVGKIIHLLVQMADPSIGSGVKIGRQVMTCCVADIQFLGFACGSFPGEAQPEPYSWIRLTTKAVMGIGAYGRQMLQLAPVEYEVVGAPESPVIGL